MDYTPLISGESKGEPKEIVRPSILSSIQTWIGSIMNLILKPPASRLE